MQINVRRWFQLAAIVFLFIPACQTTSNTPVTTHLPVTDAPVVTATSSPIPIPTAIIPPTLEPTPNITPPTFEGFNRVEILPNNFLIAYQPPPGNVYDSISIAGSGGGEEDECSKAPLVRISPRSRFLGIGGPGVFELCHFPLGEDVTINLTQPNGKVTTITVYNDYKETQFCLPGPSVVEPGKYKLEATSMNWAKDELDFVLKSPKEMTVYFPNLYAASDANYSWCEGEFSLDDSTAIYFRGLSPNETMQLLLYKYRSQGIGEYIYATTWTVTADENGNVVEYIAKPTLDTNTSITSYRIVKYNPNIDFDQVPFMYAGRGGLDFNVINSKIPTPTPPLMADPTIPLEPKWIQIPAGSFLMGASPKDANAEEIEKPQHSVTLPNYWILETEVTNENYAQCVKDNKCTSPQEKSSNTRPEYFGNPKYSNFPVVYVTYDQAQAYCKSIDGKLPTEAEWEKAARAFFPNNELYPWYGAGKPNEDIANFGNIWHDTLSVSSGYYVGYGDHPRNMAGNVWEWVEDWYKAYSGGNPKADKDFGEKFRVLRGGSFASDPEFLRISNRFYKDPSEASDSVGFRCVRTTAP